MELVEAGVLERYDVELIGANAEAIATAEDREQFKVAMAEIGLTRRPRASPTTSTRPSRWSTEIGLPVVIRPAFILGGRGTGIAATADEFAACAALGLDASPISEILIEKSIAGWKEYELEVMRDRADNCVVICSIENLDPMGVHTGDSITVAPAQTLSDVEYQAMRDAAFACIRRVGVETGGSNVQFALDPDERRHGHHRDEPPGQPVVGPGLEGHRLPDRQDRRPARRRLHARRDPQRHHQEDAGQLRAGHRLRRHQGPPVGVREVPRHRRRARHPDAVGGRGHGHRPHLPRVAAEGPALARAGPLRPQLRPGRGSCSTSSTTTSCSRRAAIATPDRPFQLEAALRRGISIDRLYEATRVDPWFLDQILEIIEERAPPRRRPASPA